LSILAAGLSYISAVWCKIIHFGVCLLTLSNDGLKGIFIIYIPVSTFGDAVTIVPIKQPLTLDPKYAFPMPPDVDFELAVIITPVCPHPPTTNDPNNPTLRPSAVWFGAPVTICPVIPIHTGGGLG
jgi:hypothetical protein